MQVKNNIIIAAFIFISTSLYAQKIVNNSSDKIRATKLPQFGKIINNDIPGAPLLDQPIMINGTKQDIRVEKHGLVYPALLDWNKDGKTDLLLGEFETGKTGSNIKVYLNIGSEKKPKYTGEYFYAYDTNGDTLTAHQWCCIGIHPRVLDINGDGFEDLLTGQYDPGLISLWRGSISGFKPLEFVPQEGYDEYKVRTQFSIDQLDPKSDRYWLYTSAGFGDFNCDSLPDLFVGGFDEMRVALNIGSKENPKFGLRRNILGIDGLPISVIKPDDKELETAKKEYRIPQCSGVIKSFITPVDWDSDGVLDLLVTHAYGDPRAKDPVVFFRGVITDKGLRFHDGIPLFTAKDFRKTFPGCQPNIIVADYNKDGIKDLIIGASLPTVNGFEIDSLSAWSYIKELGIMYPGKDPGRVVEWEGGKDKVIEMIEAKPESRSYFLGKFKDYKYLTLRHRGFVYVMLGGKNHSKAKIEYNVKAKDEVKISSVNTKKIETASSPVKYSVNFPKVVTEQGLNEINIRFDIKDNFYAYADTITNTSMGIIPMSVRFIFPEELKAFGSIILPKAKIKDAYKVYIGSDVNFIQHFGFKNFSQDQNNRNSGKSCKIKAEISYQVCNDINCLPPVKEIIEIELFLN